MKQVHANYTFVASTKTITLTGLNIAQDQLLLVTNATRGVIYYNFASSSHRAVVTAGANTTVVLTDASTTGHADSDQLTIHYDDQVSGSSVSISNFPATQVVSVSNLPASQVVSVSNFPASSSVTIANFPAAQVVTGTVTVSNKVVVIPDLINPLYSVITSGSIIRVYDAYGQDITVNTDNGGINASLVNSVTIGSLPAISGTVTANSPAQKFFGYSSVTAQRSIIGYSDTGGAGFTEVGLAADGTYRTLPVALANWSGSLVTTSNPLPISGTVTVGNSVTIGSLPAISGTVTVGNTNFSIKTVVASDGSTTIIVPQSGTYRLYTPTGATKNLNNIFGSNPAWLVAYSDGVTVTSDSGSQTIYYGDGTQWTLDDYSTPAGNIVLDGSVFNFSLSNEASISLQNGFSATQLNSPVVASGALRAQLYGSSVTIGSVPNGSLTTRFGTPTTANTAFATSAVTNANRKYLLIQNVTTGSNVITVGIGFTPTTTQGIQLTAGAGITFESSYIPTGAVYVLSSVTASNFTILEA